jgi:hypothetical protein
MHLGLQVRNANAKSWMPNDNEWYKAAYYDPNKNGPGSGSYWLYPTNSNTAPGNVIGSLPKQAKILTTVYSVTHTSTSPTGDVLTDAGAFTNSSSAYGTFDQGGNVEEWIEGPHLNNQPG